MTGRKAKRAIKSKIKAYEKGKGIPAYLTVYLSLTLAVMLSLTLALIEGTRSNAIRLEAECIAGIGLNSIFAEYHRQLYEQYNLFAIDSSYGTSMASVQNTARHLEQYLERNMSLEGVFLEQLFYKDFLAMHPEEVTITRASMLTDDGGEVFLRSAAEVMRDETGLNALEELKEWLKTVETENMLDKDIAEWKHSVDEEIQGYDGIEVTISETDVHTVQIENPTSSLEEVRKTGILASVLPEDAVLSGRSVRKDALLEGRIRSGEINQGNDTLEELTAEEKLVNRFLFQEYLLRYLGCFGEEKENSSLYYQIEYLLSGKEEDTENLESVSNTICLIREAANVIYLFSDEEKCAMAKTLATALAALTMVPETEPLFEITLILGWAYAESLYDTRVLLSGGRIPLIKTADTWHYGLEGALRISGEDGGTGGEGLSYKDYLRILLMLTDQDTVVIRAMNMVEADIRRTPGNQWFRLDGCIESLEARIRVKSDYGYSCIVNGKYGYQWY